MSEKSAGTLHCKRCWKSLPIPSYDTVCELCGCREQCEMKVRCFQCFAYMSASTMECPSRYCKHNQSFRPTRRPCYLCIALIPVNDLVCTYCKSPQDIETLNRLSFKVCPNQSCRIILSVHTDICYGCKQQQDPSVPGFPGSVIFKSGNPVYMQTRQELSDNIRGYTEIDNKVKGDNKPCILCKAPVPAYIDSCSVCLASQDIEILKKSKLKYCSHDCGTVMSAELITCFNCKRKQDKLVLASIHVENSMVIAKVSHEKRNPLAHDQNDESKPDQLPKKITCLLCSKQIPALSQLCFTCHASQDIETFKSCRFKQCSNSECKKVLIFDDTSCYSCQHVQSKPIALISGASLYSQSSNVTTTSSHPTQRNNAATKDSTQQGQSSDTTIKDSTQQDNATIDPTQQGQSSNVSDPTQQGQSSNASDPTQQGQSSNASDPTQQGQSSNASDPTQQGQSSNASDPTPQGQSSNVTTKDRTQQGQSSNASDPTQQGQSSNASDPTQQGQSSNASDPTQQGQSRNATTKDPTQQGKSNDVDIRHQKPQGQSSITSDPTHLSRSSNATTSHPKEQGKSNKNSNKAKHPTHQNPAEVSYYNHNTCIEFKKTVIYDYYYFAESKTIIDP